MEPNTGQQNNIPDTNDLDATQDVNLPPAPEIPDLETQIQSQEQQVQEGEQALAPAQQQQSELQSELFSALNAGASQGQRTIEAEEEAGLGNLRTELTDIENQIRETSLQFRRERERIQNDGRLTQAQAQANLRGVIKQQSSQLADLEVIRASRSGRLEDAQAAVDRKLKLQFADEQARIQNLQFIYNENKEILNKKEDRLFQQRIANEQAKLNIAMDRAKTVENEKLNLARNAQANGAGGEMMRAILSAKTLPDAFAIAGSYGVSIQDKINRQKLSEMFAGEPEVVEQAAGAVQQITLVDELLENKTGLSTAVGVNKFFGRNAGSLKNIVKGAPGKRTEFAGTIQQLTGQMTIDNLVAAKAQGATFGALSDRELALLAAAATKINAWEIKDKNGIGTGQYKTTEAAFKQELETIKQFAIKDFEKRTGTTYEGGFGTKNDPLGLGLSAEENDPLGLLQ